MEQQRLFLPRSPRYSSGTYRAAASDRVERDDAILRCRLLVLTGHQLAVDDDAGGIRLGAGIQCADLLEDLLRVVRLGRS
jgi:hypothetical protein